MYSPWCRRDAASARSGLNNQRPGLHRPGVKQTNMITAPDMKWNARLYDDKHDFVFKFGEDVVQLLTPRQGERILDLGSGT